MGGRARLALLAALLAGCAGLLSPPPPSRGAPASAASGYLARGELYKPGLVVYDEFFSSVHDLQVEFAGLPDDRRAARSSLTQTLGLLPTAPTERVLERVRERGVDLGRTGGRFVLAPGASSTIVVDGKASPDDRTLAQAMSGCVAAERAIAERARRLPTRAEALLGLPATLEASVEGDFTQPKRGQVKAEIAAARQALADLEAAAAAASRESDRFADDVVTAATGKPGR